jgi:hypothetical protein
MLILSFEAADNAQLSLWKHHVIKANDGVEVNFHAFLTSALNGDEWSVSRSVLFYPRGKPQVGILPIRRGGSWKAINSNLLCIGSTNGCKTHTYICVGCCGDSLTPIRRRCGRFGFTFGKDLETT